MGRREFPPRVGIALWVLERTEWGWAKLSSHAYLRRRKLAAKTVALIAHDRILTDEILTRGLPSYYGQGTSEFTIKEE